MIYHNPEMDFYCKDDTEDAEPEMKVSALACFGWLKYSHADGVCSLINIRNSDMLCE